MFVMAKREYFDNKIKVRFNEALLSNENNWNWFAEAIEATFYAPSYIRTYREYLNNWNKISEPFGMLCRIFQVKEKPIIRSNTKWVKELIYCAKARKGIRKASVNKFSCFSKILYTEAFLGFCLSEDNTNFNYLLGNEILTRTNIYTKYNLKKTLTYSNSIIKIINSCKKFNFKKIINCFNNNIKATPIKQNKKAIKEFLDKYFDENIFSYKNSNRAALYSTWEQEILFDIPRLGYSNGELSPFIIMGATESPPVSTWSSELLNKAKKNFEDERAICLIETVSFLMFDKKLSDLSFKLLLELYCKKLNYIIQKNDDVYDDSIISVFNTLIKKGKLNKSWQSLYWKETNKITRKVKKLETIIKLKDIGIKLDSSQEKKFQKFLIMSAHNIPTSSSPGDYYLYINDIRNSKYCNVDDMNKAWLLFLRIINNVRGVAIADAFIQFKDFLKRLLDNETINNILVHDKLIALQQIWEKDYYAKAENGLSTVGVNTVVNSKVALSYIKSGETADKELILSLFDFSADSIKGKMKTYSSSVVMMLCKKIVISERFPYQYKYEFAENTVSLDSIFYDYLKNIIESYNRVLLNNNSVESYVNQIFNDFNNFTRASVSLFDVNNMYKNLEDLVFKDGLKLVNLDNGSAPILGHLTQLFPILENYVRDFGILNHISHYNVDNLQGKSPSRILCKYIQASYQTTKTLDGLFEILFIYFCMYSHNGLNIRNQCVHGTHYQKGKSLEHALKITILCIMIIKRYI